MDKKGKHQTKHWRRAGSKPKKRGLRGDRSRSNTSASAKKLKESKDDSFDVRIKKDTGYSLIQFFFVFGLLEQYLSCKVCKGDVSFSKFGQKGFGFKIHIACKCGEKFIESCAMINNGFEINRRLVFVFRLLGVGLHGINLFCGLLEMGSGLNITAYYSIVETIKTAVKAVFDVVRRKAINEEKKLNTEAGNGEDLTVSGDGSWAKRGFSSLIGLVTLIGKYSKKIIDVVVLELSTNYGLAVQRNKDSIEGMRNEIWAGFYHKISTDAKPQHQYCPAGESSWCKYRKAEAKQTLKDFKHAPALSDDVQEVLKPIYEDLTKDELLERCLGGNTQNNNESFNATVWSMAPKHTFSGKKIVKIACLTAACIFNEGFSTVLKIMETMHVGVGETAVAYAAVRDRQRIQVGNRRSSEASKEGRTKRRQERLEESQLFEQSEGILYGPGIAD